MRKTIDVLRAARAVISDPVRWTQGFGELQFLGARDAEGRQCAPDDAAAMAWCALGAIFHVTADGEEHMALRALDKTGHHYPTTAYFNDHRSHADVLWMFDAAISAEAAAERNRETARAVSHEPSAREKLAISAEREAFMARFLGD